MKMKLPFNSGQIAQLKSPVEIVSLTSLRGFLAVWVVMYHFWNDVVRLFPWSKSLSPIAQMGSVTVPGFFMLSGFVLAYNYSDRFLTLNRQEVSRFLWLRLARIYPVHLVTLLVVVAMVWVSNRAGYQLTDSGYTTRDFILNLLLLQTWVPDFQLNWNYPSWSISSEWFAYILFPFAVSMILRKLTTLARAIGFALASLAASIGVMLWWRPLPFYELVLVIPTFFAGAAIYWVLRNQQRSKSFEIWRRLPELLVVVAVTACFFPSPAVATVVLLCCFFTTILALAWNGKTCHAIWTNQPAVFLGQVSYSLYMTHTLAQKILYRLLPVAQFEGTDTITKSRVLLIYIGVIVVCCLMTYYLVENPCRRAIRKIVPSNARP